MQRFVTNPEGVAPPAGNYSHSVRVQTPGATWVYVAGQVSIDPSGEFVGEGDIRRQTEQVFENLSAVLEAEGRYRSRLAGAAPDWPSDPEETEDLDELARMAEDMGRFWDQFASGDFDPERVISWVSPVSGSLSEAEAGILVAQALNHG